MATLFKDAPLPGGKVPPLVPAAIVPPSDGFCELDTGAAASEAPTISQSSSVALVGTLVLPAKIIIILL